jgi:hypothetical protein
MPILTFGGSPPLALAPGPFLPSPRVKKRAFGAQKGVWKSYPQFQRQGGRGGFQSYPQFGGIATEAAGRPPLDRQRGGLCRRCLLGDDAPGPGRTVPQRGGSPRSKTRLGERAGSGHATRAGNSWHAARGQGPDRKMAAPSGGRYNRRCVYGVSLRGWPAMAGSRPSAGAWSRNSVTMPPS